MSIRSKHCGCQLISSRASLRIGRDAGVSRNCAFHSYNHGFAVGIPVSAQTLAMRGPIGDHAWLGVGAIILDGVRIGAGAVVTCDVPDGAVAVGVPRVWSGCGEMIPTGAASS